MYLHTYTVNNIILIIVISVILLFILLYTGFIKYMIIILESEWSNECIKFTMMYFFLFVISHHLLRQKNALILKNKGGFW